MEDVTLALPDQMPLHARLYVPPDAGTSLPAVVVCHGYLSNSGFLEVPWAADLTRLGTVALFLDRRGHGRSGGTWWPAPADNSPHLAELYPDIRAAVAYLRARTPLIDPGRIALLGHSDGGTGALTVASADWEVAATVSLSASLAPWEYVNYVAPRNLLLLYGKEDGFVLEETDRALITHATRGYLQGEGQIGSLRDGTARRLLRVDGRGHLDLVYSEQARRETLTWVAGAFGLDTSAVGLSPLRLKWVALGVVLLLLLVLFWDGLPSAGDWREHWRPRSMKLVILGSVWVGGLAVASWVGPKLEWAPVQEGGVVAGLLGAALLSMGAVVVVVALVGGLRGARTGSHVRLTDIARGALAGVLIQFVLERVAHPVYTTTMDAQRLMLFLDCLVLAVPAFAATCAAAAWVTEGRGPIVRGVSAEVLLAALTAALATQWFVRMAILPVAMLALVLLFVGAYRAGGGSAAGAAAFGAVMYARWVSVICPLY